eukprot:m.494037 g.494037  ORF g.494037 m.494037 type:complete len:344 (+) comp57287_c0_seq2:57-1088(+)
MGVGCLVVGGCGFLGRHMAEQLLARGFKVTVFDVRKTFENSSIRFVIGDLCNQADVSTALEGVEIVFHCASPSPASNNKQLFYAVNVNGTRDLLAWSRAAGVKRFVLTSSASVVFEGTDIENGDETLPYAGRPIDYYTETKIVQEQLVLSADCAGFHTVAIRPHGIFGPGDLLLVPSVAETCRAGKMKFRIGDGKNIVDFTHVLNVVHGHIEAAVHLKEGSPLCAQAYNITNCEPVLFWDMMASIATGLGYAAPTRNLPYALVYFLAVILELLLWIVSPIKTIKATFTPMRVALAGTHHYYSPAKAQRDFNYKPIVPFQQGLVDTLKTYPHLRNPAEAKHKSS